MAKKILLALVALSLAFSTNACGAKPVENDAANETVTQTEAPSEDTVSADEADADAADVATNEVALEDGAYIVDFDTDSSMFHVNETMDGKATLTVVDGQMTVHLTLTSTNITNLYLGLAEDAVKDDAVILEPTLDLVVYDDGTEEEVNGFDVVVPYLDDEFDLALIGTKGVWYDHKVSVSNPVLVDETASTAIADGEYSIDVTLEGGSGRASLVLANVNVEDGSLTASIAWSSNKYDYMIVDGEKIEAQYITLSDDSEHSFFTFPIPALDTQVAVVADTTAMSEAHEIEYTLYFDSSTMEALDEE